MPSTCAGQNQFLDFLFVLCATYLYCLQRHYHSVFSDARKQDAIDLLTGQYMYGPTSRTLGKREDSYMWLHMALIFGAWSIVQVGEK